MAKSYYFTVQVPAIYLKKTMQDYVKTAVRCWRFGFDPSDSLYTAHDSLFKVVSTRAYGTDLLMNLKKDVMAELGDPAVSEHVRKKIESVINRHIGNA